MQKIITIVESSNQRFYAVLSRTLEEVRTVSERFYEHHTRNYVARLEINDTFTQAAVFGSRTYKIDSDEGSVTYKMVTNQEFLDLVALCVKANIMSHPL